MPRRLAVVSLAVLLVAGGRAAAAGLGIGDPAPKLEVKEFVKGEPVKGFDKGKLYVVEFWATWCGPCRTSIPHLSELQKKYKDVVFIGVSVFEADQSKVAPFVKEMGEKMDYRVAVDEAGGGPPGDGKMARSWMTAAGQEGIPTAFIVNGDGKIAWIGHPMEMDKPLAEIAAGKWDLEKAAAAFKVEAARKARFRALAQKLQKALQGMDFKAVVSIIDDGIKDDPEMEPRLAGLKFEALHKLGETDKLIEYGTHLVDKVYAGQAPMLNNIAWSLVEKPGDKPNPKLMKFALKVAEAADKAAEGKDGTIADTLGKAYYENGDFAKAVEAQERAVKLVVGTPAEKDSGIKERLELYKKKAQKQ